MMTKTTGPTMVELTIELMLCIILLGFGFHIQVKHVQLGFLISLCENKVTFKIINLKIDQEESKPESVTMPFPFS